MTTYAWPEILTASEKVQWRVEDLLGPDDDLDFDRPFMPDSLARVRQLDFLQPREQLLLNQIRGHGYLYTFGLVEQFILPFIVDQARPALGNDGDRDRSLLNFAAEEVKHMQLFERFRERFRAGFGIECEVIGPPAEVSAVVLGHEPLSVALLILHIEWMSQLHYLDGIANDEQLEPRFKSLLRHHWMEEAQHAKADALVVQDLAAPLNATQRAAALDGYLAIGAFLDQGLQQQARFDLASLERASLERASGRTLAAAERERLLTAQHQAMRWTYIGSGMTHPRFLAALDDLGGDLRARVEHAAAAFA